MAFKPPRPGGPQRRPLSPSERRKKQREYDRKHREDRKRSKSHRERSKSLKPSAARVALRFASQPLMTLPDYGHGNAAVPGDYHPCQHGGPCQCEGQCSCGKRGSA